MYRFKTIDKLVEEPSIDAVRGTVVHKVLEWLYDRPAAQRTPEIAFELLPAAWQELSANEPRMAEIFDAAGAPSFEKWLSTCQQALNRYFTLEDPQRIEPAEREAYVEALLDSQLVLRGFIDRVDVAPNGMVRVVDYKTGRSPGEGFEGKALFQMKFYALVIWRTRGLIPAVLQLVYLGNGEIVRYEPDERDLLATERKVNAVWTAIERATANGEWPHSPSRLCSWCSFQELCPEFGGTPPPLPTPALPVRSAPAQ